MSEKPIPAENWVRVFQYHDPDLCYETNEFVVEQECHTLKLRYGNDGGCSCYNGFDPSNFVETWCLYDVRAAFSRWVTGLLNPARAWECYMQATCDIWTNQPEAWNRLQRTADEFMATG